jgi:predicted CopG family antitoxin
MVKTITIKDDVYQKLKNQKRKEESFSDLFERLMDQNSYSGIHILKKLRSSIEFEDKEKETILADITKKRSERRF